jgi:hypothetical protein
MDKIYIVMDFVEHDLKALMETMTQSFLAGNVTISESFSSLIKPTDQTDFNQPRHQRTYSASQ